MAGNLDLPARVVLDVNVAFSGLTSTSGGPSQTIIQAWIYGGVVEVIVSPLWLAELDDVLRRDRLQRWVKGRAPEFVELFTAAASHHPDPAEGPWSVPGDPDDDYLVALAVASASLLVTGDGAIHDTEPTPPIEILTPREFITRLEAELASIAEGETRQ